MKTTRLSLALALGLAGSACATQQDLDQHPDGGTASGGGGASGSTSSGTGGSTVSSGTTTGTTSSGSGGGSTSSAGSGGTGGATSSSSGMGGATSSSSGMGGATSSGSATSSSSGSSSSSSGSTSSSSSSSSGTVGDACSPGQMTCVGALLAACKLSNGSFGWSAGGACPAGQSCTGGVCASGATTISQDTVLCGDQYYTGAFAVQGGATVTCPSGQLSIHAPTILVDPASKIDLSGTSSTPGGTDGGYVDTGNYQADFWDFLSGSGGGYGIVGGPGILFGEDEPDAHCVRTAPNPGGPAYGSLYDVLVAPGSKGGDGVDCGAGSSVGGGGGGSVQLIATGQVSVLGKILVDGAGAPTGCAGSFSVGGGGSGGRCCS